MARWGLGFGGGRPPSEVPVSSYLIKSVCRQQDLSLPRSALATWRSRGWPGLSIVKPLLPSHAVLSWGVLLWSAPTSDGDV